MMMVLMIIDDDNDDIVDVDDDDDDGDVDDDDGFRTVEALPLTVTTQLLETTNRLGSLHNNTLFVSSVTLQGQSSTLTT